MDRVATFKSFISRSPNDPFPRYGLAMEYKARGEHTLAWQQFEELIANFADYVPTYLMAAKTLLTLGEEPKARDVLTRGIDVAGRRGDQHARKELESALDELGPVSRQSEL
jgi:hypothetical protein